MMSLYLGDESHSAATAAAQQLIDVGHCNAHERARRASSCRQNGISASISQGLAARQAGCFKSFVDPQSGHIVSTLLTTRSCVQEQGRLEQSTQLPSSYLLLEQNLAR